MTSKQDRLLDETFDNLIRVGWERPTPEFRRVFTYLMIPGATEEQMGWLDELQRRATSADVAVVARQQRRQANASHLLAALDVPTLVVHSLGDRMNAFDYARFLAAEIPGARLVALESENHILLEDEPAWPAFMREVADFLGSTYDAAGPTAARHDDPRAVLSRARARGARPGRGGPRQRHHRRRAHAQRAHGRATPAERLRQARPQR